MGWSNVVAGKATLVKSVLFPALLSLLTYISVQQLPCVNPDAFVQLIFIPPKLFAVADAPEGTAGAACSPCLWSWLTTLGNEGGEIL